MVSLPSPALQCMVYPGIASSWAASGSYGKQVVESVGAGRDNLSSSMARDVVNVMILDTDLLRTSIHLMWVIGIDVRLDNIEMIFDVDVWCS